MVNATTRRKDRIIGTHHHDLITAVDTAQLATNGLNKIETKVADLLAGADTNHVCSEILYIITDTREAVSFEAQESINRLREQR
ncbi:hypothetical protein BVH03_22400 [Pseudomonas sp. PA15(2017)]|nr:hypothetical protein BVH03_22400 [Pseudomonas sp. PA15(2017)]